MKQLYTLRRTLSAIILLLASAIPCMAKMFKVDGIKYSVNENDEVASVSVVENTPSYSGDIIIPSTVTYEGTTYSVTGIGTSAFRFCSSLTSISLPESVTSIGTAAFSGCTSLTSISIPEGVTSIGRGAFFLCTSLTSIAIPKSVRSIGYGVFAACTSLTSITVSSENTVYDSREGCNAIIKTSTNKLIAGCQSTIIPESVTSIGTSAFEDCSSLTSIYIPESVTSIGNNAFNGCTSLTSITVSQDNTVYDSREGCNAIIETSTNKLIAGCQSTIIPESVTSIEGQAFDDCSSLTSIYIPESVTSIGRAAFNGCTSLTTISIPEGVTSIESESFCVCTSLTSVSLPESVTSIGVYAFSYCASLTTISIPESVTSIGESAFLGCTSLTTIVCRAKEVPVLEDAVFSNVPQSEATLYVPSSSIEAYRAADQWKDFGKILPLEEYTTGIASTTAGSEDTGVYDVYTIRGILIRKGCNSHNLNGLPAGTYILRHGNESKTVVKR